MSQEIPQSPALPGPERYPEIDTARGVAISMMILFHLLFDLNFFGLLIVNVYDGFWHFFGIATASLFLLLVGVSLTISRARAATSMDARGIRLKFLKRGAFIFACGMLVTLATWLYLHEGYVIFGILQLIGVSVALAPLLLRTGKYAILWGAAFIAAGIVIAGIEGPFWLLWAGVHPSAFASVDYTPLLPWLGVVLLGIAAGTWLYPGGMSKFGFRGLEGKASGALQFAGRHSLVIYLVHQPVIVGIITLLG